MLEVATYSLKLKGFVLEVVEPTFLLQPEDV